MVRWIVCLALVSCAAFQRGDGLDTSRVPTEIRDDYELFASRCSRCHTLARPLASDATPERWRIYVERMRLQQGSGITTGDLPGLLRFLDWYSVHRTEVR
jgi:hypothetical protein